MVKGSICEKCQKQQATITYDVKGWRKWTVCDECKKELSTCSKCKKNPAKFLQDDGKGGKFLVCEDCQENNGNQDLCQKCGKNPQSGKSGTDNWNFCQVCIKNAKDKKSGFDLCRDCKKIIQQREPGIGPTSPYVSFRHYEWKDEAAYQRHQGLKGFGYYENDN